MDVNTSPGAASGDFNVVCSFGPLASAWYGYSDVAAHKDSDSVPWMLERGQGQYGVRHVAFLGGLSSVCIFSYVYTYVYIYIIICYYVFIYLFIDLSI